MISDSCKSILHAALQTSRYQEVLAEVYLFHGNSASAMTQDPRFGKIEEFPANDHFGGDGMEVCICNDFDEVFISTICHVDEKHACMNMLENLHTACCEYLSILTVVLGRRDNIFPTQEELENSLNKVTTLAAADMIEGKTPDFAANALEIMSLDQNSIIRMEPALNPLSQASTIERLARDAKFEIRAAAAAHERISQNILAVLANDDSPSVRLSVAANPASFEGIFRHLADDDSITVREFVAQNPSCPTDVLEYLAAEKSHFWVAEYAQRNLDKRSLTSAEAQTRSWLRAEFAEAEPERVFEKRLSQAQSLETSPVVLEQLAKDTELSVRQAVAENINTPAATLDLLASNYYDTCDYDSLIHAVASNPSASQYTLERLSRSGNGHVTELVARNPSVTPEILDVLARDLDVPTRIAVAMNPHTLPETLAELAADEDVEVRDTVASSIRTPERALRLLAFDDDWQVRLNVANNANTPEDTLRKLLKDEFLVVREAALNNPSYQPRLTERCDEATEAVSALNIQNQPSARRDGR